MASTCYRSGQIILSFRFYLKTLSMLFSTGVKLGLLQEGKYAKVTENTVLRKMFEPKKQEVLEVWG